MQTRSTRNGGRRGVFNAEGESGEEAQVGIILCYFPSLLLGWEILGVGYHRGPRGMGGRRGVFTTEFTESTEL